MDALHLPPPLRPFPVDALAGQLGVDADVLFAIAAGQIRAELIDVGDALLQIHGSVAEHRAAVDAIRRSEDPRLRECRLWSQLAEVEGKFFVYRLLDFDGRIVYVGSSRELCRRIRAHLHRWPDVVADVAVEAFPTAAAMLAAERALIAAERPSLNVVGVA